MPYRSLGIFAPMRMISPPRSMSPMTRELDIARSKKNPPEPMSTLEENSRLSTKPQPAPSHRINDNSCNFWLCTSITLGLVTPVSLLTGLLLLSTNPMLALAFILIAAGTAIGAFASYDQFEVRNGL